MSDSFIRFWGVRGSYPAPLASHLQVGGNTSCVEVRAGEHVLICDAGTGIIQLGNQLVQQTAIRRLLLLLTHYHWDHICGLPFFEPAFERDWRLCFFGPGHCAQVIEESLSKQMKPPYFPVETETWEAQIEYMEPISGGFDFGPMQIRYSSVHHPGVTYGYRINVSGRSVVYMSDNECMFLEGSLSRRYAEFDPKDQLLLNKMAREERRAETRLIQGVDILIHDAQYTPEDYARKRGWGHSCYIDTVNMAIDAEVKELYLFHHDPNYTDSMVDEIHREALTIIDERGASLKCHVAREGLVIPLD